jgi:hypothetical protein
MVNSAQRTNWANVIKGPVYGTGLVRNMRWWLSVVPVVVLTGGRLFSGKDMGLALCFGLAFVDLLDNCL